MAQKAAFDDDGFVARMKAENRDVSCKNHLISGGLEPPAFCVLDRCDNHYTTRSTFSHRSFSVTRPLQSWLPAHRPGLAIVDRYKI